MPGGRTLLFELVPYEFAVRRPDPGYGIAQDTLRAHNVINGNGVNAKSIEVHLRPTNTEDAIDPVVAMIGRDQVTCDIVVDSPHISRVQCYLEVRSSGIVVLHDLSGTTQLEATTGAQCFNFEQGRKRSVVVAKGINDVLVLGSFNCVRFRLIWNDNMVSEFGSLKPLPQLQNLIPSLPLTEDMQRIYSFNRDTSLMNANITSELGNALSALDLNTCLDPKIHDQTLLRFRAVHDKEAVGVGGYAKVFRCLDLDRGEVVAVKTISLIKKSESVYSNLFNKQELPESLNVEVNIISQLHHPNIVQYLQHEYHAEEPELWIVMELMDGDLYRLKGGGSMDAAMAKSMMTQSLSALDYMHQLSIVHCDMKPANILFKVVDNKHQFKLADFGLAKFKGSDKYALAHNGYLSNHRGTANFMAPEVHAEYKISFQSDIWSLGATVLDVLGYDDFVRCTEASEALDTLIEIGLSPPKSFREWADMLNVTPNKRPSAKNLLWRLEAAWRSCEKFVPTAIFNNQTTTHMYL